MSSGWFLKEGAGRAAEGRVWWPWVVPFRQPRLQGVSSDVTPGHPRPRPLVQVSLSRHEEGAESPAHLRPRTRPSRPGWQQRRGWP